MSGVRPAEILRQLVPPEAAGSDGELLRRFAALHDHAAFAELVRRHGPLVLMVCRRVAGHSQDAEDAFQAAFLVLARKAAALSQPERLGNWLYGVAVRVAQRARRSAARRRAHEVQVSAMPDPPSIDLEPSPDIGPVLHEELSQLPGWYREAVILCDLRGVSRSEAAKTLGIPEGTLSSRLANGRKKLAERLARRGIALPAAAVPVMLGEGSALAAVPDSLVKKTCGLVADWAVGGAVPTHVHALAAGGFTMRKMLLFGLVAAALAATGIAVVARPEQSASPIENPKAIGVADAKPDANEAAIEKPDDKPAALGSPRMRKAYDIPVTTIDELSWNPDGKGLAIRDGQRAGPPPHPNTILYIPDVMAEPQEYVWLSIPQVGRLVGFTPDGKELVIAIRESGLVSGFHKLQFYSLVKKPMLADRSELKLVRTVKLDAEETIGYAFAPDGKSYRTVYRSNSKPEVLSLVEVREVDATTGKVIGTLAKLEGEFQSFALADNGSKLAIADVSSVVTVYDAGTGKKLWATPKVDKNELLRLSPYFSHDGKKLVIERRQYGGNQNSNYPLLLDAQSGEALTPLDMPDPVGSSFPPTFTTDGRLLAISGLRYLKGADAQFQRSMTTSVYLSIWDMNTGKILKSWHSRPKVSFLPNAPVLAVFESNAAGGTRLGLWDFAAEAPVKK